MINIGVIADTHVPDRRPQVDTRVLDIFQQAQVSVILHAGDVSVRRVLDQLREIAPVHAVRGNRDWISLGQLPLQLELTFEGINLGMVHGHGTLREYFLDKVDFVLHGLNQGRYKSRALATFPHADVVVFGHMHIPVNEWVGDQLIFNPGSACCADIGLYRPTIGLLHIGGQHSVKAEIIELS